MALAGLCAACAGDTPNGPVDAVDLGLRFEVGTGGEPVAPGRAFPLSVVRTWAADSTPAPWSDRALSPLVVRLEGVTHAKEGPREQETRRYRAYAMSLTDVTVPPVTMVAKREGGGPERRLRVDGPHVRVRPTLDPKSLGPVEPPDAPTLPPAPVPAWAVVAGGALALVVAAVLVARVRRRRARAVVAVAPPAPTIDAATRAREALRAIRERAEAFPARDVADAGEVVRSFLPERLGVPALERTTGEILRDVGRRVPAPARDRLAGLLGACDLVKFAGRDPTRAERDRALDDAEAFVDLAAAPS
jgi:hypothetical protein